MFVLDCKIKIGRYTFTRVNRVKIVKSVDLLSDTAEIEMPSKALFGNKEKGFQKKRLETQIKARDKVEITLSYKGFFERKEFVGYVAFIKPNTPTVTLQCEDAIYLLRQKRVNKNFGKITLRSVLEYITADTPVALSGATPDVRFDSFALKDVNKAKALQKISDEYGLSLYLNDEQKLYAGLRQTQNTGQTVYYNLHKNVASHDLTFRKAEDVRLLVKVIGVKKDNTKVEVQIGDRDGEQRTLYKYNVSDTEQLKKFGKSKLLELKYTGYEGSITSFLIPYATRGMQAAITDYNFPERAGTYFIPKVTTTFGQGGARRKVELGTKTS